MNTQRHVLAGSDNLKEHRPAGPGCTTPLFPHLSGA